MFGSLRVRLIFAFVLVSLTGTALAGLFAGLTTSREFNQFVEAQERRELINNLAAYYAAQGSWHNVTNAFEINHVERNRPGDPIDFSIPVLLDEAGRVVPGGGPRLRLRLNAQMLEQRVPIEVEGEVVGWLLFANHNFQRPDGAEAESFLARVNQGLLLGGVGATAVAVLLGMVLARTLTKPIRELTAATRAMADGNLEQTVPVRSQDELGKLALSFNQMSSDLSRASRLRRQMTADIAHDLRTPLSVILGYTEALSDDKLRGSPEIYDVMHQEAQHLKHLIDDLRTLSLADAGELPLARQQIPPRELLQRTFQAHQPQALEQQIDLHLQAEDTLPPINVDPERVIQVLGNLVSNALRYTPAGGTITLSASLSARYPENQQGDHQSQNEDTGLQITVADTGPGIDPADLPHIFDRFYRGDASRTGDDGASGLGLAIARSIVMAHNGTIAAANRPESGAIFTIHLPYHT